MFYLKTSCVPNQQNTFFHIALLIHACVSLKENWGSCGNGSQGGRMQSTQTFKYFYVLWKTLFDLIKSTSLCIFSSMSAHYLHKLSCFNFWIKMSKFQTGIWKQSIHGRVKVRTLHVHRLSPEEICDKYAAQIMLFHGQDFPNEESQKWPDFVWSFYCNRFWKSWVRYKKPEFQNLTSNKPNWQSWCNLKHIPSECITFFMKSWKWLSFKIS